MEAGQNPASFWSLTLREVQVIMRGAAKRMEREQLFLERSAYLAAHLTMVGFHKPDKFPKFEKVRSKPSHRVKPKRQSWESQKAIVAVLNAAFGGKVMHSNE